MKTLTLWENGVIREYTPEEYARAAAEEAEQRIQIAVERRQLRNSILAGTDWTQLPDSTVDKQTWATYRQALRDVPSQPGFPDTIVWPVPPA